MKKKVLAMALSLVMVAGMLTGCGDKKDANTSGTDASTSTPAQESSAAEPSSTTEESQASEVDLSEHVELSLYLCGNTVNDDSDVMEKVNEYLKEKINVTLKPIWGSWADFENDPVTLALQGGDNIDMYFTCSWTKDEYNKFARDGYWVRLDAKDNNLIEKYAPELWAMLPDVLTKGATINGADGLGVYAIPGWKDYATQNCWDVNVPLLEKYGYTVEDIANTDFYGFGEILQTVKDGEGADFYPLLVEGAVLERMVTNSIIVTGDSGECNLLSYYIDPTDVSKPAAAGNVIQNKFATEEYKKFVEKVREYYLAGFIDPAMANKQQASEVRTAKQKEGAYLIGTQSYSRGYEVAASTERGFEVAMVPSTPAYVDTTAAQGAMIAVSTASKHPDRAVMFLNLLNTDPYLMTLLAYGVEGTHYTVNDIGELVLDADVRAAKFQPWVNGLGNVTQLPPLEGQGVNFQQEFKDYYAAAKAIPILGYSFDQTPVETEVGALANIASQYALSLSVGFVDPATELPKFLKALEDNGIQKVIDSANEQLKPYLN